MKASELRAALPEIPDAAGPARAAALALRERLLFDAVVTGQTVPIEWATVEIVEGEHRATMQAMTDALLWGEPGDAVRANVSHRTAQRIADHLGLVMPTAKIAELAYRASAKLAPQLGSSGPDMSRTSRMFQHSAAVDDATVRMPWLALPVLFAPNVGKIWVTSIRLKDAPTKAANFGWFDAGAPNITPGGLRLWQTVGLRHDLAHVDYSQVAWFVRPEMFVDGRAMLLADVLRDPKLADLVSWDGAIPWARHPGVPLEASAPTVQVPKGEAMPDTDPAHAAPPDASGVVAAEDRPTLRRGDEGPWVTRWQRELGRLGQPVGVDGDFGGQTERSTIAIQRELSVGADGVVEQATWEAADRAPTKPATPAPAPKPPAPLITVAGFPFVQARHFRDGRRDPVTGKACGVDLIVIHTMEALEKITTAEACARYFAAPGLNAKGEPIVASAHLCLDADSVVLCVREADTAYAAPGANHNGLHLELAGYARQTAAEWGDDFSRRMLARAARLCSDLVDRHEVPVVFLGAAELRAGARGFTTHAQVSLAWKKSTHTDPGAGFPMAQFLAMVAAA